MRLPKAAFFAVAAFLWGFSFGSAAESQPAGDGSGLDFANGLYARRMYGPAISEYEKFIRENPKAPDLASAEFRMADSLYFLKDHGRAIAAFRAFLKDFPEEPRAEMAEFRIACSKFHLKEFATSQKIFFKLARTSEDAVIRSGSLFYFGKVYEAQGRAKRALKIFERVIKSYPDSDYAAYAGLAVGDVYAAQKDYERATAAYEAAASKKEPAFAVKEAALQIAELHFIRKDLAKAREYYSKAYTLAKSAPEESSETRAGSFLDQAMNGLLYTDYQLKDAANALTLYRTNPSYFEKSASRHESLYVLALTAAEGGHTEAALEVLGRLAADADPANRYAAKARLKKAELWLESGKTAEAGSAFTELGSDADPEVAKRARYFGGVWSLKSGDRPKAKKNFLEFAETYPTDPDAERALLQAVQIELDSEAFEEAHAHLDAFAQRYPESPLADVAVYKKGLALAGLKRHEESAAVFASILDRYPRSVLLAEATFGAAAGFEAAGKSREAAALYDRLMREFPEHALARESQLRLAHLHAENEEYERAAAIYERALFAQPDAPLEPEQAFWLVRYYLDAGRYEDMRKALTSIRERFPKADLRHEMAFFDGESALGLKDMAAAEAKYRESIAAQPDGELVPHAHLGLGIALAAQNRWVDAENEFAEALRFDSEIDVTLRARFEIAGLRLRAGDVETAAKTYMLVAILYDDDKYCALALTKAAECYDSLGQADQAAKVRAELFKRYPNVSLKEKA